MSDKIAELAKRWKEILALVGLLVSMGLSTYTWITTKFAMKEYVDYNTCYLDKHLQANDYTMKVYILNSELEQAYRDVAAWQAKYERAKAVPIGEMVNYRKMSDYVSSLQSDLKTYSERKKAQEERDCVKESKNVR